MSDRGKFRTEKGTHDILPPDTAVWNLVEQTARDVFTDYGFGEIRLPIFEQTELFARSIGADTDVVSKEMYTFEDYDAEDLLELRSAVLAWAPNLEDRYKSYFDFQNRIAKFLQSAGEAFRKKEIPHTAETQRLFGQIDVVRERLQLAVPLGEGETAPMVGQLRDLVRQVHFGDSITLRPEATASVCRAYIQHGMRTWPQPVKLYYVGPMFRRERPQRGRYRQFYQIGAEVLGQSDVPTIDAELIEMLFVFFRRVGFSDLRLSINSIGDQVCRAGYVDALRRALVEFRGELGPDSQRRIETNPLRILDSKVPSEQAIIEKLPRITNFLCGECLAHFERVREELDRRDIPYRVDWRLVRGLDYYTRTTFEIVAEGLGSQDAICGGGRYDGLVEILGGPPTKGIGFAIGTDRLLIAAGKTTQRQDPIEQGYLTDLSKALQRPDVAVLATSPDIWNQAAKLASDLRSRGLFVYIPRRGAKVGQGLESAGKLGVQVAILVGEDELRTGTYRVRVLAPAEPKGRRDLNIKIDEILRYGKLVKLRQDLEKALLVRLTSRDDKKHITLQQAIRRLVEDKILPERIKRSLEDLVPVMNRAIHGRYLASSSVDWALAVGNLILNEIERLRTIRN